MLTENTVSKLHEMKLSVMAQSFREQMTNHEFVDFPLKIDSACSWTPSGHPERVIA